MNRFDAAYNKVMVIEGGYIVDKDDTGGETYKGVARVFNPAWAGWKIIDSYKEHVDFPQCLDGDTNLQELVRYIYKKKYYDPFLGDQLDESVAEEMFDQAVNLGIGKAIEHLQRALNILNTRKTPNDLYENITADGNFSGGTLKAYNECVKVRGARLLFNVLNGFQCKRYIELMEATPIKEKYIGWFNRIEIKK